MCNDDGVQHRRRFGETHGATIPRVTRAEGLLFLEDFP